MVTNGVRLPDSQHMDYNVKLENMSEIARPMHQQLVGKRLHLHGLLAAKHIEVLVGKTAEKMTKFIRLLLCNKKLVNNLVCIQEFFNQTEVTTNHLKNDPHMHDRLEIVPEGTIQLYLGSWRQLSPKAHEPD